MFGTTNSKKRRKRAGAAVVELAITLPVLLTLILGSLEMCNSIRLRKDLTLAAYEGSMISVLPSATSADVTAAIAQVLHDRGVNNFTIRISPSDFENTTAGTYIEIEVSAKYSDNCIAYQGPFSSITLTGSSTFMKEN